MQKEIKIENRGAKPGTNRKKPVLPENKKKTVSFQIKAKHVAAAKIEIQAMVDKINEK